jgi:acetyl esterase/lipase
MHSVFKALVIATVALAPVTTMQAQLASFTVTVVPPVHGTLQLVPPLPPDGKYPAGTVVTVKTTPDRGYVLDSAWYSVPGRFGQMYHEGMAREFAVTIDRDKRIGASFIEEAAVKHVDVTHDVVYARPGVKPLKYDVFAPKGARNLPVIVIIHGGGWVANDENIMRGLARELTRGGRFVVFSMDYRWAGKEDGDATSTTMANIIEDVFGGIAHIMEHAKQYGGDPSRIGVTGDSAGGHLSAAASLMPKMIGSRGFGKTPGVFEFMPSYVPKDKTVEQVRTEMMAAIKAAAPSYGVFRAARLNLYTNDPAADESWKRAVAPLPHIPPAKERAVPQFQVRGTRDRLVLHDDAQEFLDALVEAGQRAEYIQVGGAGHAFFDWKPDESTKATFARYGVYYAAAMKAFFESVLY